MGNICAGEEALVSKDEFAQFESSYSPPLEVGKSCPRRFRLDRLEGSDRSLSSLLPSRTWPSYVVTTRAAPCTRR